MIHPVLRISLLLYAIALAVFVGPMMLLAAAIGLSSLIDIDAFSVFLLIAGCGGVAGVAGLILAAVLPAKVMANAPHWQKTVTVCVRLGELAAALALTFFVASLDDPSSEGAQICAFLSSALVVGALVLRTTTKLASANKVLQATREDARA